MATRRRSIHSTPNLNFRPNLTEPKQEPRGTKPTTKQSTVKEVFVIMIIHICKKSLFFDTNLKVAIYLGALFLISLIADVVPIPKGYLSRSDNAFNQFFVKFAWGWNLTILVPYVVLSSYVYCCGQVQRIAKHHVLRIVVATAFWWLWTTVFNVIETNYGKCNVKSEQFNSKQSCLKGGHYWNGFDLSGHCFILIYGSLVLIEETRSIVNWDAIKDSIRLEEHYRVTKDTSHNTNILRNLNPEQFRLLKINYEKYTPYVRGLFITIAVFQILWDVMLVCTMLYHHIMIEKFLGGSIAVMTWYFTYQFWYPSARTIPRLPGDGLFKYTKPKPAAVPVFKKRTSNIANGNQPMFMGRPLKTDVGASDTKDDVVR